MSRKYSAIVTPVYGAMNCSGAISLAPATTTVVYSIAPKLRELVDDARDGRLLLPDGDVEAVNALALLVDVAGVGEIHVAGGVGRYGARTADLSADRRASISAESADAGPGDGRDYTGGEHDLANPVVKIVGDVKVALPI